MRRSAAAIMQSARSIELGRMAKEQTEAAILASLKLLRRPVYPDDRPGAPEQ
jgi:hypothetical protein